MTTIPYTTRVTTRRTLTWTETVRNSEWTCGPITVRLDGDHWHIWLDGKPINTTRPWGYHTAVAAMASAGMHKAVRAAIQKQDSRP